MPQSCRARLELVNDKGFHARASAKFVKCAEEFRSEITVQKDGIDVPGTSIMGLLLLAAAKGSVLEVTATGEDAHDAIAALRQLVANRFGEES